MVDILPMASALASAVLLVPHAMVAGGVPRLKPFELLDESHGVDRPESPYGISSGDGESVRGQLHGLPHGEHMGKQPVGRLPPAGPLSLPAHLTSYHLPVARLCCDGAARAALPAGQLRSRSLVYFFRASNERTPPRTTMERCADSLLRTPAAYRGAVCSTTQLCSRRAPSSVFIQETAWSADQVSLLGIGANQAGNKGGGDGTTDAHHNGRHDEPCDDVYTLWATDAVELERLASPAAVSVARGGANRAVARSTDTRRNRSETAAVPVAQPSKASPRRPSKGEGSKGRGL